MTNATKDFEIGEGQLRVAEGDNAVIQLGFHWDGNPGRIKGVGDVIDVPWDCAVQVSHQYDTCHSRTHPATIHGPARARVVRYAPGDAHTFARIALVLDSSTGRIEGGAPFLE